VNPGDYLKIEMKPSAQPVLTVVVDTEEEFDWSAGFNPDAAEVGHMERLGCFQEIANDYGVQPAYLVTYAIVNRPEGYRRLLEYLDRDQAVVGAHLHPWVTPPKVEAVNRRNSYPGNLTPELEREKLTVLTEKICARTGLQPKVYKAGRYGIGPASHRILSDLGYEVDTSPAPPMDFSGDGGPNFSTWSTDLLWYGKPGGLLCLPCTGAFTGRFGSAAPVLYGACVSRSLRLFRLPGVLARLGLLDRIRLTPEGYSLSDLKRLTRFCYAHGTRVFSFNLHSSTVQPRAGHYVQNEEQLRSFLGVIRAYFEFFFREMNGTFMPPLAIKASVAAREGCE
jgi:hypothetical protein